MKYVGLAMIRLYQLTLSRMLPAKLPLRSELLTLYLQAIEKYGLSQRRMDGA